MPKFGKTLLRDTTVIVAIKVQPTGRNYAVTYDTGYTVTLPASAMTADLLAMATV